jgi:hypothetical protein
VIGQSRLSDQRLGCQDSETAELAVDFFRCPKICGRQRGVET